MGGRSDIAYDLVKLFAFDGVCTECGLVLFFLS